MVNAKVRTLVFGGLQLVAVACSSSSKSLCNRNGVPTESGGCKCDAAWRGSECSELALQAAPAQTLGTIYPGRNSTTTSSWGGTVTKGADGQYHLLVSEMLNGCGIGAWKQNSAIRHATSATIDGVYTPRELVMNVFSHNAACMDARPAGGPACILLHIGGGTAWKPPQQKCSGGYTPAASSVEDAQGVAAAAAVGGSPYERRPTLSADGANKTFTTPVMAHFATGERWANATLACGADASGSTACNFDNPSGWVDRDGTAWIAYVSRSQRGFGLAKAPHWQGPYVPLARAGEAPSWKTPVLSSVGTPLQNCEDGVIYRDARGGFHLLFHYYGSGGDGGDHGGHAHASASGEDWAFTVGHTWNTTVPFDGGEAPAAYGFRQRPHVVLSPETGQITHLITGVVFDSARPYPTSCTRCTGFHGPCDRSWTVMQPVGQGSEA